MITVKEVYDLIDSIAPYDTQMPWDNSGLMTGAYDRQSQGMLLALDCTNDVIEQALNQNIRLIVCHHPLIFHPVKHIDAGTPLYQAVKSDISVLSAHTNLDMADGGVNDVLAGALGLTKIQTLSAEGAPILRTGEALYDTAREFAAFCAGTLKNAVKFFAADRKVRRVAVCGGAGGEYIRNAFEAGCDTYVTGEARHHEYLLAQELGMNLLVAGHYATETIVMNVLGEKLCQAFPEETVTIARQGRPYETVIANGA